MFDKALAVNNFGMWPEPEARLKDLRGALRPDGRVAIVSQPRCLGASAKTTERVGEENGGAASRGWLHQPPQGDAEPAASSGLRLGRSSLGEKGSCAGEHDSVQ